MINNFALSNDTLLLTSANVTQSGTYSVTTTQLGCVSAVSILTLTVLQTPQTPVISTNTAVCVGDTIFLNTTSNEVKRLPHESYPKNILYDTFSLHFTLYKTLQ